MLIDLSKTKCYYVSLNTTNPIHIKRQAHMKELIPKMFANYEYVNGINANDIQKPGYVGVSMSLLRVLWRALLVEPFEPFVFLQDDVTTTDSKESKLPTITLPDDIDACFLGISWAAVRDDIYADGGMLRKVKTQNDLFRIGNMLTEHAILFVTKRFALAYFATQTESIARLVFGDCLSAKLQETFEVYALAKPLFYQKESLQGKETETRISWTESQDTCSLADISKKKQHKKTLQPIVSLILE